MIFLIFSGFFLIKILLIHLAFLIDVLHCVTSKEIQLLLYNWQFTNVIKFQTEVIENSDTTCFCSLYFKWITCNYKTFELDHFHLIIYIIICANRTHNWCVCIQISILYFLVGSTKRHFNILKITFIKQNHAMFSIMIDLIGMIINYG